MASKRRVRWSPEMGQRMVAAHEASGLSMNGFARQHGFEPSKLKYWRKKMENEPNGKALPTRFVELVPMKKVEEVPLLAECAPGMVIMRWPNGPVVEVPTSHLDVLIRSMAMVSAC